MKILTCATYKCCTGFLGLASNINATVTLKKIHSKGSLILLYIILVNGALKLLCSHLLKLDTIKGLAQLEQPQIGFFRLSTDFWDFFAPKP